LQTMPKVPRAPVPQMAMPSVPQVPQVAEVPYVVVPSAVVDQAQPGLSFFGGLAGGFAAGAALVYSLVKRTGQKVSLETKRLELGALTSVDVESPSVAATGAPNSSVVESTALAPYLARGADLPTVLKQVTSGRTAMPAFGRPLRAINAGRGRRVVVNMAAKGFDKSAKEFAYGLPGGGNILGEFDPAGYLENKSKLEVYRLREAELTHGRVGMLASLGFIVQEKFHPLFSGDGGPAIDQIPQLPVWLWAVMIGGIGAAESKRIAVGWAELDPETSKAPSALREGYYPGDLGFDPLGLKPEDPAEFRLMQEKELSHCRLAMIAAAGFLAQEAVSRDTWGAYWGDASF